MVAKTKYFHRVRSDPNPLYVFSSLGHPIGYGSLIGSFKKPDPAPDPVHWFPFIGAKSKELELEKSFGSRTCCKEGGV